MEKDNNLISIIIPLGPNDRISNKLDLLLNRIDQQRRDIEIILISNKLHDLIGLNDKYKIISHQGTRASAMNIGAEIGNGKYLFFLHCDSYLSYSSFNQLIYKIKKEQSALFYFDFRFYKGMPFYYKLTEFGVMLRCILFNTPFGDQGLTISKNDFIAIGGYSLNTPFGEDYILVQDCKKRKIKILRVGQPLFTSPRKYTENGWLKTTIYHQKMWYKLIIDYKKGKL